ncbi:MAG: GspE/PulE family protein [Marinibacterium sp.]
MDNNRFSYGFARAEQIALDGPRMLIGPEVTEFGLREVLRRAGSDAQPVHMSRGEFDKAIAGLYRDDGASDIDTDDLSFDLGASDDAAIQPKDLLEDGSDAPVVRLVNQLLRRAVQIGASDLHFEPVEQGLRVRARVDGFLQTLLDQPNVPVARITSRLKVMAALDIAETRLPQDGRIALRFGGRAIDARVSTLPGGFGERVVLRILDRTEGLLPLADLGLNDRRIAQLERLSARPDGIILATGPTGSGKTTTLYSLLKLANRDERNLITVEDPVEYNIEGLNQTQIDSEIGMTFAAGLRAALRQDPDVILVGEIRDAETASIAGQAALTGHLVFSSLHANTAVGAVVRLRDLGVENYLIAATLRGVIAQRLLRKLCPVCRQPTPVSQQESEIFQAAGLEVPDRVWAAKGCDDCNGSGYRGRVGVYNIVVVDEDLRTAIDRGESDTDLRKRAKAGGGTLLSDALDKVAGGITDWVEIERVLGEAG